MGHVQPAMIVGALVGGLLGLVLAGVLLSGVGWAIAADGHASGGGSGGIDAVLAFVGGGALLGLLIGWSMGTATQETSDDERRRREAESRTGRRLVRDSDETPDDEP